MKEKWTRILVLNLPYFIMFYLVNRGAWLFRHCTGDSQIETDDIVCEKEDG